jgi:hypothetical protein
MYLCLRTLALYPFFTCNLSRAFIREASKSMLDMLTPQEVLMHAQAALIPGRKPPATEGSLECYPCRVVQIGELGGCDGLNGVL